MVGVPCARPRPLALLVLPPPPLLAPRLALPPPVSLMPPRRLEAVELPDEARPEISLLAEVSPPLVQLSLHSPIWSLSPLSWSLICARRDHRNSPAAAAPAATAVAASGRSRAKFITPQSSLYWLRPDGLLLRLPRLLLFAMRFTPTDDCALEP